MRTISCMLLALSAVTMRPGVLAAEARYNPTTGRPGAFPLTLVRAWVSPGGRVVNLYMRNEGRHAISKLSLELRYWHARRAKPTDMQIRPPAGVSARRTVFLTASLPTLDAAGHTQIRAIGIRLKSGRHLRLAGRALERWSSRAVGGSVFFSTPPTLTWRAPLSGILGRGTHKQIACPWGQSFNRKLQHCTGRPRRVSFDDARLYCRNLVDGGFRDWQLPRRGELLFSRLNSRSMRHMFWTRSPFYHSTRSVWVAAAFGSFGARRTGLHSVLCVRRSVGKPVVQKLGAKSG